MIEGVGEALLIIGVCLWLALITYILWSDNR